MEENHLSLSKPQMRALIEWAGDSLDTTLFTALMNTYNRAVEKEQKGEEFKVYVIS